MLSRIRAIVLLVAIFGAASATEINVKVIALFSGKAMLQVNGEQKIVSNGETFEGVLLKSASGRGAVVEIDGEEMKLGLNQSIAGNFKKPERTNLKIYPDEVGMYFVRGKINDRTTDFLVDTGATFVTLSGRKASSLGVDYRKGQRSSAQTAASVVTAWLVRLDSVTVGGILVRNVDAMVIPGNHPTEVLLGNSFLSHTSMERAGQVLEIRKRF
jgi:aspartyl protease family protein